MSKHATTLEQTFKEDRQRKLEERLNRFQQKAQEYMGESTEEHLDIFPQYTGWENGDDEDQNDLLVPLEEDEGDEDENSQTPETMAIHMPSSLKPEDIRRLGLEVLAAS